jgi:hypothetical protein
MVYSLLAKPPIRFVTDALIGLGVFATSTVLILWPASAAHLAQLDGLLTPSVHPIAILTPLSGPFSIMGTHPIGLRFWAGPTDPQAIITVLAFAFSLLFALNLAFVRHIRRTHAGLSKVSPRMELTAPVPDGDIRD